MDGQEKYDIAEEKLLLAYVAQKFHERYTNNKKDYFQEFLDLVYPFDNKLYEDGKTNIDIEFSYLPLDNQIAKPKIKDIKSVAKFDKIANKKAKINCIVTYPNENPKNTGAMSRTVLQVMQYICKSKNFSYNALKLDFPDEIAKKVDKTQGFTGFRTVFTEKTGANSHDFFVNEPIELSDKKIIVISKQWNRSNFHNFIERVEERFKIKIVCVVNN